MSLRAIALVLFALLFLGAGAAMKPSLDTMKAHGGKGILALEAARTRDEVSVIRRVWGDEGDRAAKRSIWIDFLFIVGYGGFLATAAWWAASVADGRGWTGYARFAAVLAIAFVVAALCDVAENVGMLAELRGGPDDVAAPWPLFASTSAWVKWRIIYGGGPALAFVWVVLAARRR